LVYRNLQAVGGPKFTSDEQEFARQLQKTYGVPEVGLDESVSEMHGGNDPVSDNAEYTWFAPICMLHVTTSPRGVTAHSWGTTASVGSSIGKKALDVVGRVNAGAALDLIARPDIIDTAKKEMKDRLGGRSHTSLVPESIGPPLMINRQIMDRFRPLQERFYQEHD
jgi:aminobenzoyl-glutamate utilization protein B